MREIKFKYYFKDRENKIHILTESIEEIETHIDIPVNIKNGWELIARCEYTGLKDKNGKEIYEGDIVKNSESCGLTKGIVEWDNEYFGWSLLAEERDLSNELIVIGNIYENPKLLK